MTDPIVLDLVGVGVSRFRMDFVMSLLDEVHVDVIKGTLSEVKAVMEHGRCDGGIGRRAGFRFQCL